MNLHQTWRVNYRKKRDLDHLSTEDLSARMHDCINNMRTRTARNKIGLLPVNERVGHTWMALFTECLEECVLRGYARPGPINLAPHRASMDHAFDPIPDMERAFGDHGVTPNHYILKFGDPKWLRQSFDHGKFRVASASYYDSDAHNHARRDTEMQRFTNLNMRNPMRLPNEPTALGAEQSTWQSVVAGSDYLLFCLSGAYSARLFGDFASSGCLLIHKPNVFLMRIVQAMRRKLPGWDIDITQVTYYDPVRVNPKEIVVSKFKPFKHAYQSEGRIIALPPTKILQLDPIEIEIGSIADCATYVDLSSHPSRLIPHDPKDEPIQIYGTVNKDPAMIQHLPDAAKIQGIILDKSGHSHRDWFFKLQYTDAANNWHELKLPMLDGLYLLNLFKAAEQEQGLGIWNLK